MKFRLINSMGNVRYFTDWAVDLAIKAMTDAKYNKFNLEIPKFKKDIDKIEVIVPVSKYLTRDWDRPELQRLRDSIDRLSKTLPEFIKFKVTGPFISEIDKPEIFINISLLIGKI